MSCEHRYLNSHIDDKDKVWWICDKCGAKFRRDGDGNLGQVKEESKSEGGSVKTKP